MVVCKEKYDGTIACVHKGTPYAAISVGYVFRMLAFAFVMTVAVLSASAQKIVKMDVPRHLCVGDTFFVSFGVNSDKNIVFQYPGYTLGHTDTVFLPDGIPCGDMGCAYQSSVTYVDFPDTAHLVEDDMIRYLCLNMEHSYIGDIYISLECPNGQKVDVMRFGGILNSSCADYVPESSNTWLEGENVFNFCDFGQAVPTSSGCNPNNPQNVPGVGWNYCWSDNANYSYNYATNVDDGIIYRYGHSNWDIIDSSNVANFSNFYHPDQPFQNLLGCPLNGQWTVTVIDGYAGDNGYLFGWSLSLDATLIGYVECPLDSFSVLGPNAVRVDDSSFFFYMPDDIDHDTTVRYIFRMFDECGNRYDTSTYVTFHAAQDIYFYDEVFEDQLPYTFNGVMFLDSVSDMVFPPCSDRYGCDSTVHFTLDVWRSYNFLYDTTVCDEDLPVLWHGISFDNADTLTLSLQTVHDADSIVVLQLAVQKKDTTDMYVGICNGAPYTWVNGVTYYDDSQHPLYTFTNTTGACDSVVRLNLMYNGDSYKANIRVSPNPVVDADTRVKLQDLSNSISRLWTFDGHLDTARNCSFVFEYPKDSVEVLFTGQDVYGCTDTASVVVYSNIYVYWVPNVITPDESTNKTFSIFSRHILSGMVHIYSRAGLHITDFDALTGSWDGTKNGKPCPQGAYVWKMEYITDFNPQIRHHVIGTVTILR